ncbi:AAA-like domain-containing protein [Nostoc sp. 106C]|uniref:AAA-like domain-containing protein n=1 Tax=Nostoc sp. 106C TaxID=1932667 RepID=UPI000A3C49E4|nr:AAA-like domain-containing protein [Nostoc sp. 106C]OUL28386.1 serine/threonine protein kinase [Nostoc sp. RF31YmG]OUL33236.1 serine/threonine protein kinase [Nostoc sp. 106C]
MRNIEEIIEFAINLVSDKTGQSFSYIHKVILRESLLETKKTYAQIAQENNYSENYIKFCIAPRVWQLLSTVVNEKVNKTNCRALLEQYIKQSTALKNLIELQNHDNLTVLESPEGQVPLASALYIERPPIEETCYREILQASSLICIKAPRRMGKTSLIARILDYGTQQNYRTVRLSLNLAGTAVLTSIDRFLRWFCTNVTQQLGLESHLNEYWDEDMGALINSTIYFQAYLLPKIDRPVVLALDSVSQLFEYPHLARDFLALLRSWYEESKDISVWQKLRMIISHSTEIYIPLPSNRSPFNVGLTVELPPFNREQVKDLAQRHELQINAAELDQLMILTEGFPYLVRLAMYQSVRSQTALNALLKDATTDTGIYSQHLQYQLWHLQQDPKLIESFQQVLLAPTKLDIEVASKLKSLGLVQIVNNQATVSCGLYQKFFSIHVLN